MHRNMVQPLRILPRRPRSRLTIPDRTLFVLPYYLIEHSVLSHFTRISYTSLPVLGTLRSGEERWLFSSMTPRSPCCLAKKTPFLQTTGNLSEQNRKPVTRNASLKSLGLTVASFASSCDKATSTLWTSRRFLRINPQSRPNSSACGDTGRATAIPMCLKSGRFMISTYTKQPRATSGNQDCVKTVLLRSLAGMPIFKVHLTACWQTAGLFYQSIRNRRCYFREMRSWR